MLTTGLIVVKLTFFGHANTSTTTSDINNIEYFYSHYK